MTRQEIYDYFKKKGYAPLREGGHLYKEQPRLNRPGTERLRVVFQDRSIRIEQEAGKNYWVRIEGGYYKDYFIHPERGNLTQARFKKS